MVSPKPPSGRQAEEPAKPSADQNISADHSAKTRYTVLVTQTTERFIQNFMAVCKTDLQHEISLAFNSVNIKAGFDGVELESVLARDAAHQVFRACYGYRSWLLAPEDGVRGLLRACFELYGPQMQGLLETVATALKGAAQLAMKRCAPKSKKKAKSAAEETVRALLLDQALNTIETWREQTSEQLSSNLRAEAEFPDRECFAQLKERLAGMMSEAATQHTAEQNEEFRRMLEAALAAQKAELAPIRTTAAAASVEEVAEGAPSSPAWGEWYMGWLLKRSRKGQWQRRWFALSLPQRRLWYFGSPEEQPARAEADLSGARLIETSDPEDGHTTFRIILPAFGAVSRPAEDPGSPLTKTHLAALTLRASTEDGKRQWCEMLAKAITGVSETKPVLTKIDEGADFGGDFLTAEASSPVERKISTKVFDGPAAAPAAPPSKASSASSSKNEEIEPITPKAKRTASLLSKVMSPAKSRLAEGVEKKREEEENKARKTSSAEEDGSERSSEEEELDTEELAARAARREERERLVFEEIAAQAQADVPTEEEWAVLECVTQVVGQYMMSARASLTAQTSKVIADGMLPYTMGGTGGRAEELREELLRVLMPADSSMEKMLVRGA